MKTKTIEKKCIKGERESEREVEPGIYMFPKARSVKRKYYKNFTIVYQTLKKKKRVSLLFFTALLEENLHCAFYYFFIFHMKQNGNITGSNIISNLLLNETKLSCQNPLILPRVSLILFKGCYQLM